LAQFLLLFSNGVISLKGRITAAGTCKGWVFRKSFFKNMRARFRDDRIGISTPDCPFSWPPVTEKAEE
jgi:hypothetical protein